MSGRACPTKIPRPTRNSRSTSRFAGIANPHVVCIVLPAGFCSHLCARCDNSRWVCEDHTDRPWWVRGLGLLPRPDLIASLGSRNLNAARDQIIATQPFAGPMGHGFHPNLLRIGTRGVKSCLNQSLTAIVEPSHARLLSLTL